MAEALKGLGSCCSRPVNYTRPRGSRTQSDRGHLQRGDNITTAAPLFPHTSPPVTLSSSSSSSIFVVFSLSFLRNAHYILFYSRNLFANDNFCWKVFVTTELKVQIVEGPPLCSFRACLFVCLFGSCNITMCHVPSIMSFMAYCEEKVLQTLLERSSSTNVCPFPNFLGENSDWLCFSSQCMCELFNIVFLGGGGRMPPGCVDDEMPLSTFSNILKSADYYHYR